MMNTVNTKIWQNKQTTNYTCKNKMDYQTMEKLDIFSSKAHQLQ